MTIPENPRALVTGGGSGLGRAFCLEIAARGGRVAVADLRLETAEETAKMARDLGAEAFAMEGNVVEWSDVEKMRAFVDDRMGGVDLLINNAGVAVTGPIGDIPLTDWNWIVGVNMMGVVHGCHAFVPRFKSERRGHIINVASAAGLVSTPEMGPYNMTKAAVVALSETLHVEAAPFGVGVTVLCPTFFRTGIIDNSRGHGDVSSHRVAGKLMDKSKLQAREVACAALDGAKANELYVVPMADGRWFWRVKRLAPSLFYRTLTPRAMKMLKS